MLGDGVQKRDRLQAVAGGSGAGVLDHPSAIDGVLHRGDDQALAQLRHPAITEVDHLGEVVPGVHVHDREREAAGAERLLGEAEQDGRVLTPGEQQHRALELRCHFAHDVDRLGLE